MVVVTAMIGMMATIFSSLNERRREMAIFRAMGARPATILGQLVLEAMLTAAVGALLGVGLVYLGLVIAQPIVDSAFGLWLPIEAPSLREALGSSRRHRRWRDCEPCSRRFAPTGFHWSMV